ncbi:MAG TPA: ABC transporter ATP-binding protein [Micromonosporaceae bacterium]
MNGPDRTAAGADEADPPGEEPALAELNTAYWQLDPAEGEAVGTWRVLTRVPAISGTVLRLLWRAAPRSVATILVLQVAAGVAATWGLLATTGVLEGVLTAGPTPQRLSAALPALLLVAAAYTARGALDTGVALTQARLAPTVRRIAEEHLLEAGLRVELSALDDPGFYDRMHRARDRGLFYLERAIGSLIEVVSAALAAAAAGAALLVLHPLLLPVLVVCLLPEAWASLRSARLGYASMTRTVTLFRRARMMTDLATDREPAPEIRACQAEPFVLAGFRQVADPLRDEEIRLQTAQTHTNAFGRALGGVSLGVAFVALGLLLQAGWIPLAVAGTAVIAIRSAAGALGRLVRTSNLLFEQGMYVADYQAFLADAQTRRRVRNGRPAPRSPGRISLHGVTFSYPGSPDGVAALRDVDLTLRAGETIALVGENGSGKTTLAKLLAGLYRPTGGRVTWDGTDLAELDPDSVAGRVMMVLQNPVRWPNDARLNVRVGRHDRVDPDDAALHQAAGQSGADQVVAGLPYGWKTLLSKYFRDGQDLSGGQWQRLAVARGLFRAGPLLIWDEPTAPLDARAEHAVYESLRRLARDRTVVLITHRLASVRNADRIYLLHEGRVAEQGSHRELLATGGRYAQMYELQARMYAADHSDEPGVDADLDPLDPDQSELREQPWRQPQPQ